MFDSQGMHVIMLAIGKCLGCWNQSVISKYQCIDLNVLVLVFNTFNDGDIATPTNETLGLYMLKEEGGECQWWCDTDEFDYKIKSMSYEILLPYFLFVVGIPMYHII